MKKATEPRGTTKPAQKKPARKKLATKPAKPVKVRGGTGLAEVVAQLALSAEKLSQAADRLAEATARPSVTREARHESLETLGRSTADSTTPRQQAEAADATDGGE